MSTSKATLYRLGNIPFERVKRNEVSPFIFPQYEILCAEEKEDIFIFSTREPLEINTSEQIETIFISNFSSLNIYIILEGSLQKKFFILDDNGAAWINHFKVKNQLIMRDNSNYD